MTIVRGHYRGGRIDLEQTLDLPDDEPVYITVHRDRPTELMTAEEVHKIVLSFNVLDEPDESGWRNPRTWDKLWQRTPAEAAAEIMRRWAEKGVTDIPEYTPLNQGDSGRS
jgi:hypothetical protein